MVMLRILLSTVVLAAACLAQPFSPESQARRVLDQILSRQYDPVYAMFGDQMRQAVSPEKFRESCEQLVKLGTPESIGKSSAKTTGANTVVTTEVKWKQASFEFGVSWGPGGEIAGAWFRLLPPPAVPAADAPAYSRSESFTETPLTVGEAPWTLPGILARPKGKGPFPALVLVHGSGPNDRDETVGPIKVFRDLAHGLASRGIAVLRYDKRTRVYPEKCAADPDFTMTRETVEDALAAAALLRTQPDIDPDRIFILGHSQGGYMMPRILRRDPKLAGGIVLAGNVRPIEVLVVEQTTYLASLQSNPPPELSAKLAELRKDPAKALRIPPAYLADLKDYHPAAEAAKLKARLLILQGERDYQVTIEDFKFWKAALGDHPSVTFRLYPKLNHLFLVGEGKSTPAEYSRPGNVDPAVVSDIAGWVASEQHP